MREKWSKKMLTFSGIIGLVLLVVMVSSIFTACPAPTPTAKPTTLVLTTHDLAISLYAEGFFKPWIAEIEKRTEGRVKIEAHYGGELAPPADAYDAARTGSVDIAHFITQWVPGKFPIDDLVTLPSLDKVNYRQSRTIWELYKMFPEYQAEYKDVKVLLLGDSYFSGIATVDKPIRKLEDNQGLKMVSTGRWTAMRGEALGWTSVTLAPGDVYSSLEKGVVDGGPFNMYYIHDYKLTDLFRYQNRVHFGGTSFGFVMNLNTWNSLPTEIQTILDDMSEWSVDLHDQWQLEADAELESQWTQEGVMEFIRFSKEELARWVAVDEPVRDALVAELEAQGLPGEELMDEYLRLEEKYSAPEYALK
jgi:TRAP-type C4-dicarboxylate transport system substrate-binding protein